MFATEATQIAISLVVGEDDDKVWARRLCARENGEEQASDQNLLHARLV